MNTSAEMTGGEAVVSSLVGHGVQQVFGIASIHNLPIFDALLRDGSISVVATRHEQGAVHAADGYARATGRLGVAIASTGPGTANATAGLYEASFASSPVLLLTGQVHSDNYGKGKGAFHEAERQLSALRAVTRRAATAYRGRDIPEVIDAAIADILWGRNQPGAIEIPIDVLSGYDRVVTQFPVTRLRSTPSDALIDATVRMLSTAKRPIIWSGGGAIASGASREVRDLASRLAAPVVTSIQGRGIIDEDEELALGAFTRTSGVAALLGAADVVLAIGTRFQEDDTAGWSLTLGEHLIHIDIDSTAIGRVFSPTIGAVGDAKATIAAILDRLTDVASNDENWEFRYSSARRAARGSAIAAAGPDHVEVMNHIRRSLPRDALVVRDATIAAYVWGDRLLPIHEPRTSFWPSSGAIGPSLPLAIGAVVGAGRRGVVITGDGGLLLSLGELATAAQYDVPLVICVFNDGGYGVLRRVQDASYAGRRIGVDLTHVDFAGVAVAMGLPGERVDDVDTFRRAFDTALSRPGPSLLDIDVNALGRMALNVNWTNG